jgi:hypothetical protein
MNSGRVPEFEFGGERTLRTKAYKFWQAHRSRLPSLATPLSIALAFLTEPRLKVASRFVEMTDSFWYTRCRFLLSANTT